MSYSMDSRPGMSYAAGFFILFGLMGAGILFGGLLSAAIWSALTGQSLLSMQQDMLDPANANAVRIIQLVSAFFLFFLPAVVTAFLMNRKPWTFLGYERAFDSRTTGLTLLIMIVSLPLVGALAGLMEMIPLTASLEQQFRALEKSYEQQVAVMATMNNFTDYLISLVIMALAPAVFEETFFRGGMQNLLHRWTGKPILAILLTSLLFSFIHFSWFGFLPRVALGVVLGLIFYQTGNLWLAILAHFFNNALVVSLMYYLKLQGKPIDGVMKDTDPLWVGVVATVALYCLFRYLSWFGDKLKTAKRTTEDRAREEQWIA